MKLNLSQEVIDYIAGSISANVRELEGALVKLAAFGSLTSAPCAVCGQLLGAVGGGLPVIRDLVTLAPGHVECRKRRHGNARPMP